MSKERITIALVGDDAARTAAREKIITFATDYSQKHNTKPPVVSPPDSKDDLLARFSFEDYEVTLIRVTEFNDNLPEFDGAILAEIKEGPLPSLAPQDKEKPLDDNKSLEEKTLETLDRLKKPIKGTKFIVKDARENPYFCLAEKINCTGDAFSRLLFYRQPQQTIDQKQTSASESEPQISAAEQTFLAIENTLKELIRVKKILGPIKAVLKARAEKTAKPENIVTSEKTTKILSSSQEPYRKKLWLLLFPAIPLAGSITLSIIMGLQLVTPPISFIVLSIAIALFISTFIFSRMAYMEMRHQNKSTFVGITHTTMRHQSKPSETMTDTATSDHAESIQAVSNIPNNQSQDLPNPVPYSSPTQNKPKDLSRNPAVAEQAVERLRMFLTVVHKNIRIQELGGNQDVKIKTDKQPEISVICKIENNGEIFLHCLNTNKHRPETIKRFQEYENQLKASLGQDIQMDRLPVMKVLELPEEMVRQQQNDKIFQ